MSWLSKLFGSEKKDTTYTGAKPFGSLSQAMGGQQTYDELVNRLAGRGIGYSDGYDTLANPAIRASRSRFNSYDIPELTSELSASGRRGGSGGFDQIRRAYGEQGMSEDAMVAELMREQEQAKREDKNNALTGLNKFALSDSAQRSELADFDYADNKRQVAEADIRRQRQAKGMQDIGKAVVQYTLGSPSSISSGIGNMNPATSFSYANRFNPTALQNNIGYGKSGNSLTQRLAQRAALSGRY